MSPITTFHPLPRPPPNALFARFRRTRAGQALDLLLGAMRGVNLPPSPPLQIRRSWISAVISHGLTAVFYLMLYDLLFRFIVVLAPDSFGHPSRTGGDFPAWVATLAPEWGISWWITWAGLGWVFMGGIMLALHGQYHLVATLFLALGYNADEEWPAPIRRPWMADSLNDLWGKRYHQVSPFFSDIGRIDRVLTGLAASQGEYGRESLRSDLSAPACLLIASICRVHSYSGPPHSATSRPTAHSRSSRPYSPRQFYTSSCSYRSSTPGVHGHGPSSSSVKLSGSSLNEHISSAPDKKWEDGLVERGRWRGCPSGRDP